MSVHKHLACAGAGGRNWKDQLVTALSRRKSHPAISSSGKIKLPALCDSCSLYKCWPCVVRTSSKLNLPLLCPTSLSALLPVLWRIKCKLHTAAFKCRAAVSSLLASAGPTLLSVPCTCHALSRSWCLSMLSLPPRMPSPELSLSPPGACSNVISSGDLPWIAHSKERLLPPLPLWHPQSSS